MINALKFEIMVENRKMICYPQDVLTTMALST
jgi:hypothetical protein